MFNPEGATIGHSLLEIESGMAHRPMYSSSLLWDSLSGLVVKIQI